MQRILFAFLAAVFFVGMCIVPIATQAIYRFGPDWLVGFQFAQQMYPIAPFMTAVLIFAALCIGMIASLIQASDR